MKVMKTEPRYDIGLSVRFMGGSAGFTQRERGGKIMGRKFSTVSGWHYEVDVEGEGIWVIPEMSVETA